MNEAMAKLGRALGLAEQKLFRSATRVLREGLDRADIAETRTICAYNLGAIYWGEIGDGVEARRLFQDTFDFGAKCVNSLDPRTARMASNARANACENSMMLSLSYDEYYTWAERLKSLEPNNDILRGQLPKIREYEDKGTAWCDVMYMLASAYYNRNDASLDPGRYGSAKSIFHLLLTHRKQLRLPRTDWSAVVQEFGALTHRICADCLRHFNGINVEEYSFIMEEATPFVEEYVASHPGDQQAGQTLGSLNKVLAINRKMMTDQPSPTMPFTMTEAIPPRWKDADSVRETTIGISVVIAVLGATLVYFGFRWGWLLVAFGVAQALLAPFR